MKRAKGKHKHARTARTLSPKPPLLVNSQVVVYSIIQSTSQCYIFLLRFCIFCPLFYPFSLRFESLACCFGLVVVIRFARILLLEYAPPIPSNNNDSASTDTFYIGPIYQ